MLNVRDHFKHNTHIPVDSGRSVRRICFDSFDFTSCIQIVVIYGEAVMQLLSNFYPDQIVSLL